MRTPSTNIFGHTMSSLKKVEDFNYLRGLKLSDIILFDNSTAELYEQGAIILPNKYYIFEGNKDGEYKYKPYEYDQYRIVVTTHKGIIISVDSIG